MRQSQQRTRACKYEVQSTTQKYLAAHQEIDVLQNIQENFVLAVLVFARLSPVHCAGNFCGDARRRGKTLKAHTHSIQCNDTNRKSVDTYAADVLLDIANFDVGSEEVDGGDLRIPVVHRF